jgi:hypothetical protein
MPRPTRRSVTVEIPHHLWCRLQEGRLVGRGEQIRVVCEALRALRGDPVREARHTCTFDLDQGSWSVLHSRARRSTLNHVVTTALEEYYAKTTR